MLDLAVLNNVVKVAAANANAEWIEQYGRDDFGTCGFATVLIHFNRKRKLKKFLEDNNLIGHSWDNGWYVFNFDYERVPTQNISYFEKINTSVADVIQEQVKEHGATVKVHSWVD